MHTHHSVHLQHATPLAPRVPTFCCQHMRRQNQAIQALPVTEPTISVVKTTAVALVAATAGALLPTAINALVTYLKPRKCKTCYGAGYYPCTVCHGRGKVHGVLPDAPPSGPCLTCVRGRMTCQDCNKTGLANAWLWQPAKDPGWGARGE